MIRQSVTIRGVEYENTDVAAAAFGITRDTVSRAKRLGRLDFVGLHPSNTRTSCGAGPMPVRIRGKLYPSAAEAARKLGVTANTVHTMISTGREDFIGFGRKRSHRKRTTATPGNAKEVRLGQFVWPSICAAVRDLDTTRDIIHGIVRRNDTAKLLRLLMARDARKAEEARKAARKAELRDYPEPVRPGRKKAQPDPDYPARIADLGATLRAGLTDPCLAAIRRHQSAADLVRAQHGAR